MADPTSSPLPDRPSPSRRGAAPAVTRAPDAGPAQSLVPSAIAYALLFGAIGAWPPYSTLYFHDLGIDLGRIGLLAAIPAAVSIVAAPAWGLVADRLGDVRPPLIVAGVWAVGFALVLVAEPPVASLGLLVAALAAGSAAFAPLVDARTVQRLGRHRERYGQARLWGSIAFIVVSTAVGALVAVTSTRASLVVYAGLLGAGAVAGALLLGRSDRGTGLPSVRPAAVARILADRSLLGLFLGLIVVWTASNGIMTFFSLQILQLGGDAQLVGIGWAVNAIAEVPIMYGFARLARRVGVPRLMIAGAFVFAVRAAGWALVNSALAMVLVTTLGGVAYALVVVGVTTYVAGRVAPELRATAQGLFMGTTYATGSILGAVIAGWIAGQAGLAAVFPAGIAASLAGALIVWLAIGRPTSPGGRGTAPSGPI